MIRRQGEVVYAPCGHCGGDGWAIFQRGCQALYELGDDWATTAEMAERLRVSTTNAANILSALLSGDIVERRKRGRQYEWRRKDGAQ